MVVSVPLLLISEKRMGRKDQYHVLYIYIKATVLFKLISPVLLISVASLEYVIAKPKSIQNEWEFHYLLL